MPANMRLHFQYIKPCKATKQKKRYTCRTTSICVLAQIHIMDKENTLERKGKAVGMENSMLQ